MAFTSAAHTGDTEATLILSIVQEELVHAGKLLPTVTDYSSAAQGSGKQLEVPRFDSHFNNPAAQNPDGTTATSSQEVEFATDSIPLDKWVTLPYDIPDRVSKQSSVNLEAEIAASAGRTFGRYMDAEIIAELRKAADGTGSLPDHVVNFSGTEDALALADILSAKQKLDRANVSTQDRFFLIPPEKETDLLSLDNIVRADQYGSRDALLDGEVGRLYGFRVITHNGLANNEAIAYQKGAVGYAIQKQIKFEQQRGSLKLQRDEYAVSAGWGVAVLEQGVKQVYMEPTPSVE